MKNILNLDTGKEWGGGTNSLLASYLFEILTDDQLRLTISKNSRNV